LVLASDRETDHILAPTSDREAIASANITLEEIETAVAAGLVARDGDQLVIHGFDHRSLATYNARRAGGVLGGPSGKLGGRPKKNPSGTPPKPLKGLLGNPSPNPSETPHEPPFSSPIWEERASDDDAEAISRAVLAAGKATQ
jgi:hypothetical protein